jgi:hypothetical protein
VRSGSCGNALALDTDVGSLGAGGSFANGGFLGVYLRMPVTWRLPLGDMDGEPVIVLLNLR